MRDTPMKKWTSIGSFIGKHMVIFVMAGLACGIFVPSVLAPLRPAVPFLFALTCFQGSLGISVDSLKRAITHPAPMLVILAYAHVIAPIVAYALGMAFFGYDHDVVAGIVIEYATPLAATSVMWVGMYRGDVPTMLTSLLASTLIAPFTIPLTLQLLIGTTVEVDAAGMIVSMLVTIALPSLAGVVVNARTKDWARQTVSPVLAPLSRLAVPVIVSVNATSISDYMLHLTPELVGVVAFIGCFSAASFFAGMALAVVMRQSDKCFTATSFACGMRNITAGAVIAVQYFPAATVFPVIVGTFYQQLLAAVFGHVIGKIVRRRAEREENQSGRA